ncbi:hypothetical protein ACNQGB_16030 [Flavobacterium sp. XS1P32]|jgi:hypothetical protein|uniref:hypothetical protein n=1 Tax=unclassified Flavobacterium TaxID=196869 RepID=UPI003AAEC1E2
MKYENLKEFITSTKSSKSTIYRFYKKNIELFDETKLKSGKRFFPVNHARYFDSEIMFDENKILRQENQSMKNLIDCCLIDKGSLQFRIWQLDWSFFITVAYKAERNKKSCFKQMHGLYEHLEKKYGNATALRLFFTSEPFTNRIGYHNHLVLDIANKKLHQEIISEVQNYFSYDRVDIDIYDPYKAGVFYMTKEGTMTEDWDILGNNLKANTCLG